MAYGRDPLNYAHLRPHIEKAIEEEHMENHMVRLRAGIIAALIRPMFISELEEWLDEKGFDYYKGEVQEVVWRLTAAKILRVLPTGMIEQC